MAGASREGNRWQQKKHRNQTVDMVQKGGHVMNPTSARATLLLSSIRTVAQIATSMTTTDSQKPSTDALAGMTKVLLDQQAAEQATKKTGRNKRAQPTTVVSRRRETEHNDEGAIRRGWEMAIKELNTTTWGSRQEATMDAAGNTETDHNITVLVVGRGKGEEKKEVAGMTVVMSMMTSENTTSVFNKRGEGGAVTIAVGTEGIKVSTTGARGHMEVSGIRQYSNFTEIEPTGPKKKGEEVLERDVMVKWPTMAPEVQNKTPKTASNKNRKRAKTRGNHKKGGTEKAGHAGTK